jgi:hypothetical protein
VFRSKASGQPTDKNVPAAIAGRKVLAIAASRTMPTIASARGAIVDEQTDQLSKQLRASRERLRHLDENTHPVQIGNFLWTAASVLVSAMSAIVEDWPNSNRTLPRLPLLTPERTLFAALKGSEFFSKRPFTFSSDRDIIAAYSKLPVHPWSKA